MNLQEQISRIKSMMGLTEMKIDDSGNLQDFEENIFDEFPEEVLKTLEENYLSYIMNFDWNKVQDSFIDGDKFDSEGFGRWIENHKQSQLKKNINKIISIVRRDMILIKRRKYSEQALRKFEELLLSVFGSDIKGEALSEFEAAALLYAGFMDDVDTQIEKIEQAFRDAKKIVDDNGDIDYSKITKSTLFDGEHMSYPKFERFIEKNPQYKRTYNIWKKLHDKYFNDSYETRLVAYYEYSIKFEQLYRLYKFLIQLKKEKNLL